MTDTAQDKVDRIAALLSTEYAQWSADGCRGSLNILWHDVKAALDGEER